MIRTYGNTVFNGGNVGIGTSSPNDILDIHKANSQLRLTDTDDSKFVQFSYSGGKLITRNNSTNTTANQFTLTEDGNVGIGTIAPTFTATTFKGLEVEVSGDLFPNVRLERVSGSSKTNQAYEMVVGSAGNWHVRNATTATAPLSIATDDAVTVGGTLGVTGAVTANAGVNVDTINIDGSTISASSSLTLDLGGNLTIDVDGTGLIEWNEYVFSLMGEKAMNVVKIVVITGLYTPRIPLIAASSGLSPFSRC